MKKYDNYRILHIFKTEIESSFHLAKSRCKHTQSSLQVLQDFFILLVLESKAMYFFVVLFYIWLLIYVYKGYLKKVINNFFIIVIYLQKSSAKISH